jgi:hypothetical protein
VDVACIPFLFYGGVCGFHYGPTRQVSTVCEKNIYDNRKSNGRSWAGVLGGWIWVLVLTL